MKILAIDDNAGIRMVLRRVLQDHELHTATDGVEAIELLSQSTVYDMILMDVRMPGLSGAALLAEVRERSNCPIIAITGASAPAGFDAVLTKPIGPAILRETIDALHEQWIRLHGG